jgi:pilus assembly protein FimV
MNAVAPSLDLGFDTGSETTQSLSAALEPTPSPAASEPMPPLPDLSEGLTFSLDVADSAPPAAAPAPVAKPADPGTGPIEFDLGSLTLDLDASTPAHPPAVTAGGSEDDPLATKLALAEEFNAIGDADGARALVEEVIAEASGNLKTKAQRLLTTLG